ncbi:hypothetical protein ACFWYW_37450 [Nonomuraea sp. NPDC059023]
MSAAGGVDVHAGEVERDNAGWRILMGAFVTVDLSNPMALWPLWGWP